MITRIDKNVEKSELSSMAAAATAAKLVQSCPTLWDPIDGSPLGSSVPGILQARVLEWVAISFCNAWKWKVKVKYIWLGWCKIMQLLWKIVQQFLKNLNTCVNLWGSNFTPRLAPKKNETMCPNFNMGLHSHISHNTKTWKHHTPMVN